MSQGRQFSGCPRSGVARVFYFRFLRAVFGDIRRQSALVTYHSLTIARAFTQVKQSLLLPAIQCPYFSEPEGIIGLLDSLKQGYPSRSSSSSTSSQRTGAAWRLTKSTKALSKQELERQVRTRGPRCRVRLGQAAAAYANTDRPKGQLHPPREIRSSRQVNELRRLWRKRHLVV